MKHDFSQTRFLAAAGRPADFPADDGAEVVFCGRSNAGKSSAINTVCRRTGLAKTSKSPGATRTINFFETAPRKRLVDLPGYGYAKASFAEREHWRALVEAYIAARAGVRGVVLIMDIRRPLTDADRQLIAWRGERPLHILLTKADKLGAGAAAAALRQVARELPDATAQTFSSQNRDGVVEARRRLASWLEL